MTAVYITLGCVGGAALIGLVVWLVLHCRRKRLDEADMFLVNEFSRCNVMVFGKKGSGKDVLFAHVIALRGEKHYANIPYDQNTEVIELWEVSAGDNTFEDLINGSIRKFDARFDECADIYISDAGIYFPNTTNKVLDDKYPSMPVLFALSRHLYHNNIHTNCQAFGRPWKKIREQADSYIQVLRTVCRGDCLYVRINVYGKESDAENEKNVTAKYTVRVPIGELQYDSRYFREMLLNRAPSPLELVMANTTKRRVNYNEPNGKKR